MSRESIADREEKTQKSLAGKTPLSVSASVLMYALALEDLAKTAKRKGVDDVLFSVMIDHAVAPAWRGAMRRCRWVLDHIDDFRDENGTYDLVGIVYALNKSLDSRLGER